MNRFKSYSYGRRLLAKVPQKAIRGCGAPAYLPHGLAVIFAALFLFSCASIAGPYVRADWPHWLDTDGDCLDTRAEVLAAQSLVPVTFRPGRSCVVASGVWRDPYSGRYFVSAGDLDIDHIVPLAEAHLSGGDGWSREQRAAFANDPGNLLAVDKSLNRSKGSRDPAAWRPPVEALRCDYARRWWSVKRRYGLSMDWAEVVAVLDMLAGC